MPATSSFRRVAVSFFSFSRPLVAKIADGAAGNHWLVFCKLNCRERNALLRIGAISVIAKFDGFARILFRSSVDVCHDNLVAATTCDYPKSKSKTGKHSEIKNQPAPSHRTRNKTYLLTKMSDNAVCQGQPLESTIRSERHPREFNVLQQQRQQLTSPYSKKLALALVALGSFIRALLSRTPLRERPKLLIKGYKVTMIAPGLTRANKPVI